MKRSMVSILAAMILVTAPSSFLYAQPKTEPVSPSSEGDEALLKQEQELLAKMNASEKPKAPAKRKKEDAGVLSDAQRAAVAPVDGAKVVPAAAAPQGGGAAESVKAPDTKASSPTEKPSTATKKAPSEKVGGFAALQSELTSARAKIAKLSTELDEARNRLMIAETEVERLSVMLQERTRVGAPRNSTAQVAAPSERASYSSSGMRVREPGEIQAKAEADMPIATVTAQKAQLRTGPGMNNSPLMTVSQGTRLAIETRSGQWYRVISPTGARAWISSDAIDFGDTARPDSAMRSRGVVSDAEQKAFDLATKGAPANPPTP